MTPSGEQAVTIQCEGEQLLGLLHRGGAQEKSIGVLIIVGGPQYRVGSHRQFVLQARTLAAAGYPVLRFDYRGMGDSSGEPRTFEGVDADIQSAIDEFVRRVPTMKSIAIFGLCDAASAALIYCQCDDRLAGLMLANPWVRSESGLARAHVKHYYGQRLLQGSFWRKVTSGRFNLLGSARDLLKSISVLAQGKKPAAVSESVGVGYIARMREGLAAFDGPVLVLMSENDLTAKEFSDLCIESPAWSMALRRANVQVRELPDADHTFSSRAAMKDANEACLNWLSTLDQTAPAESAGKTP